MISKLICFIFGHVHGAKFPWARNGVLEDFYTTCPRCGKPLLTDHRKLVKNHTLSRLSWAEIHTKQGLKGFLHFECGFVSFHTQDLRHRYCGKCHKFVERQ